MIDITGVDLKEFAKAVYLLSEPKGMGFLHAKDGPLSDEDATSIVCSHKGDKRMALCMDYVHGRACKMKVYRNGEALEINESWYDHTDTQLESLLSQFGISTSSKKAHRCACECEDCQLAKAARN